MKVCFYRPLQLQGFTSEDASTTSIEWKMYCHGIIERYGREVGFVENPMGEPVESVRRSDVPRLGASGIMEMGMGEEGTDDWMHI